MENITILITLSAIFIFIISSIKYISRPHSLNKIKAKTVGDGQHGVDKFMNKIEVKKVYKQVLYDVSKWRKGEDLPAKQGIVVGCKGKDETVALVDTDDIHCLMIGASGVGKTAYFLYPNLEYACATGTSFLTTDTKGDLVRNYGEIAKKYYGYDVSVLDLRNPTKSSGNNMLHLVNKYMDTYSVTKNIKDKAKAEKYAKIISKTIILSEGNGDYGQNSFFYDSAEGLLTSTILLVSEFLQPKESENDKRHIISVFKIIQELSGEASNEKNKFQKIMEKLPNSHKAKWFSGSALGTSAESMASVISTVLSRLNVFLDTEMEEILCFDTEVDAEDFSNKKSAVFLILPEEDSTKYFMVSLFLQQFYRELLGVADANGGKLKNKVIIFADEIGTIPKIQSFEMMLSAGRSRGISVVSIIQSFAQLEKNYGKEGSQIIIDNNQLTIFVGFAPTSETAETLSKMLGNKTVLSGSISVGKDDTSKTLQMSERALMTPGELKALKKGNFIVMKTGCNPMKSKFKLFLEWGIYFEDEYEMEEKMNKKVEYADGKELEVSINKRYFSAISVEQKSIKKSRVRS